MPMYSLLHPITRRAFAFVVNVHFKMLSYYYLELNWKRNSSNARSMRDDEELDGPAVSVLRRSITKVKQRWSVIGWVTKNLLSRAPPCFGRHVKSLVPAAFAVVNTHQPSLGPRV
jgi:hypothetical protein